MWYALFILGGPWFWGLIILESLFLFWAMAEEWPGKATGSVVLTIALVILLGNGLEIGAWAAANLILVGALVLGYFAAGTLWSVGKWFVHVSKTARFFKEAKVEWLTDAKKREPKNFVMPDGSPWPINPQAKIPPELQSEWDGTVISMNRDKDGWTFRTYGNSVRPENVTFSEYKGTILFWMCYWPWSFVWTMINDFVRAVFEHIRDMMKALFESIKKRAYNGAE